MPYNKNKDLPPNLQDILPDHAQDIYREAYNSAWDQYKKPEDRNDDKDRESTSHAVAWSAVKDKYSKQDGQWHKKKAA